MPKFTLAFNEATETRRIFSFIRRTILKAEAKRAAVGLPYYSKSEAGMKLVDLLNKYQMSHSYTRGVPREGS